MEKEKGFFEGSVLAKLDNMEKLLTQMSSEMKNEYVKKDEFRPYSKMIWSLVAGFLTVSFSLFQAVIRK